LIDDSPILCVGAAHWDVIGRSRLPLSPGMDAPGSARRRPGGVALNIALALGTSRRRVILLSVVGDDADGDALMAVARTRGIDCSLVLRHGRPTGLYVAIEDSSGELFAATADCEGLEAADARILDAFADGRLPPRWPGAVAVVTNVGAATLAALADRSAEARMVAVSCASAAKAAALGPLLAAKNAVLYLNRAEAEAFCGETCPDTRSAAIALRVRGVASAVVTDGPRPATHVSSEGLWSATPPTARVRGVTGAGDALLAAHLAALIDGAPPPEALRAALDRAALHISEDSP